MASVRSVRITAAVMASGTHRDITFANRSSALSRDCGVTALHHTLARFVGSDLIYHGLLWRVHALPRASREASTWCGQQVGTRGRLPGRSQGCVQIAAPRREPVSGSA